MKNIYKVLLLILTITILGVIIYQNSTKINETSLEVIKVGYPAVTTSLPLFVAIEEGLFKKRGLTIEPVKFETANQIVEALVTGRIEATSVCADYPFLSIATKKENTFKIYAQEMLDTEIPFDVIIAKKDSQIDTLADLEGKTVATFPGSQLKHYFGLIMEKALGKKVEVNIIEMAPANHISALATGSVDAVFTLEPLVTIATSKGIAKVVESSVISKYIGSGESIPAASFAISTSFDESYSEQSKGFVDAMVEAIELINKDQNKYSYLYPTFTPVSEELAPKVPITYFSSFPNIDESLFQKEIDILYEAGLLDKKLDAKSLIYKR